MPRYEFECDTCGCVEEFVRPIAEGPPQNVNCPLCLDNDDEFVEMRHCLGGAFILKGGDWPSKEFKGDHAFGQVKERTEHVESEDNRHQRIVNEVMDVRRKGKQATNELKKNNPQKFADYQTAVKKGFRAKGKSYSVKGKGI